MWRAILDLLTKGRAGSSRDELLAITGVTASVIADKAPQTRARFSTTSATIEICRLKNFRCRATRYDKLATDFASAVTLAAVVGF
jgi:hypothetical protein